MSISVSSLAQLHSGKALISSIRISYVSQKRRVFTGRRNGMSYTLHNLPQFCHPFAIHVERLWLYHIFAPLVVLNLTILISFTATERAERDDLEDWYWQMYEHYDVPLCRYVLIMHHFM
jgi:hypothetical protein